MNVNEYREKTRKRIVCPSGLELEIRKVRAVDYLRLGILPDVLSGIRKATEGGDKSKLDELAEKHQDVLEKVHRMMLTSIVIPQENFRIVNKPVYETAEGEISWEEIEPEDLRFIVDEINRFSRPETEPEQEEGVPGSDLEQFSEESVPSTP